MADLLTLVAVVAVVGLLLWWLRRNDGHWCSPDGLRFTCRLQPVGPALSEVEQAKLELRALQGLRPTSMFSMGGFARPAANGARREARGWSEGRATIAETGVHLLVRRGLARQVVGPCRVLGRTDDQRQRAVYLVDGPPGYQLRVPSTSPCVAHLDKLITR